VPAIDNISLFSKNHASAIDFQFRLKSRVGRGFRGVNDKPAYRIFTGIRVVALETGNWFPASKPL
jgi:hypothetical protein